MGLEVKILSAGACSHPEFVVIKGGRFGAARFPSMFAVIQHPSEGVILFDTGYSQRFFEASRRWPYKLYAWTTPVELPDNEQALPQLDALGIQPSDVSAIVCSHFHADHVAGLGDFPEARFIFLESAWEAVSDRSGFSALLRGFLPDLIPADFEDRAQPIPDVAMVPLKSGHPLRPLGRGFDLFGDKKLTIVGLPGHAAGQIGLHVVPDEGPPVFLVADACWRSRAVREQRMPHPITSLLFESRGRYADTLGALGAIAAAHPEIDLVPSHCDEVYARHIKAETTE